MPDAAPVDLDCPSCRFGRFELRGDARQLLADGQPVALGARAFDLLAVLVARAGRLVSKHDLLNLVWAGLVVEENNLQVQVSSLRKLLGAGALTTIPGRGYRFDLPVERGDDRPQDAVTGKPAALPDDSPAGPTRAPTNLPARLSTLFGRAEDLGTVKALLARHAVVTIAGTGGIGKTRLAEMVAAEAASGNAEDYPDGVWWVELAPLSDEALVPASVARVLGTQLAPGRPPLEMLASMLVSQRLLLVLDNCEHLSDAVAALVETLRANAPGVRILVTSQETLKTTDEHVYRIGALEVPAGDVGVAALRSGAVELFAARAQAADPHFALTAANVPAAVEICRRLDGIPLAIELAAARLPLLGVEGLRQRLDERFNVLTAGTRTVLRRHQTLRATLEWSHGLLTAGEQKVFRRLGVFSGSFTLDAAQYAASDAEIDAWAALDHLGALVDKSLVLAEGDPLPRYRLLETARAYALERLADAGETLPTLRRHAEAICAFCTSGDDVEMWHLGRQELRACAAEIDNLRAALAWAGSATGSEALAVSLAASSARIWTTSAQIAEGMERCLALHQRLDNLPKRLVAKYWQTVAYLGLYTTRRESYDAAVRAADLYRELGDDPQLYNSLVMTAAQGIRFATESQMQAAIDEAARLERSEWPGRYRLEFARYRLHNRRNQIEEALASAKRQVAMSRDVGNVVGAHYGMSNVTGAEISLGRPELALEHAQAAIAELDRLGAGSGAGHLHMNSMVALILLDRLDEAMAAGRIAYALLLREGDEIRVFTPLALCLARRGRTADAARIAGYVDAELERAGMNPALLDYSAIRQPLLKLLEQDLAADELARLRAEGAAMSGEQAYALAANREI